MIFFEFHLNTELVMGHDKARTLLVDEYKDRRMEELCERFSNGDLLGTIL